MIVILLFQGIIQMTHRKDTTARESAISLEQLHGHFLAAGDVAGMVVASGNNGHPPQNN